MEQPPAGETCPESTFEYKYIPTGDGELADHFTFRTCYCEQHCSWDECYLVDPPETCLKGSGRVWVWSSVKTCWVAQMVKGNSI